MYSYMKAQKGGASAPVLGLNLGARCLWLVQATLLSLYPGKRPKHPLERSVCGPQNWP
jgi:hypothetical protein